MGMARRLLLAVIGVWFSLSAQNSAAASFSGQLKSSTDVYPHDYGPPTETVSPYLSLDLNGKHKLSKRLRWQARALILTNTLAKSAPEKLYGDLPEAFMEYKSSGIKLRGGMDTVNWGLVDISSPADTVNPTFMFHPLRTLRRGAPMLEALWDNDNISLHAIYIPRQQRPLLPSSDSRWLPRDLLLNLQYLGNRILLPQTIEYTLNSPKTLDHALDHNAGLKLMGHFGRLDLQATHFEGAAPSPRIAPTFKGTWGQTIQAESPVGLAPVAYRVRTSGIGAAWAAESFILRLETAYQHTISKSPLLSPWMWSNVLALETKFDIGSTSANWLLQFYYTKNPQAADNFVTSSYRLFDQTVVTGARWSISDNVNVMLSALYEAKSRGLFAMAGFEQKLNDALKWSLAWRDFSAAKDGLLKTFAGNDHACLELIYYF